MWNRRPQHHAHNSKAYVLDNVVVQRSARVTISYRDEIENLELEFFPSILETDKLEENLGSFVFEKLEVARIARSSQGRYKNLTHLCGGLLVFADPEG